MPTALRIKSGSSSLQDIANRAAQEYNPTERAISKGYTGVKKTANEGVSFQGTSYMHTINGVETKITIPATGTRSGDFDLANSMFKFDDTPDGYVWHHLDDYNVENNTFTLELVQKGAHNASKPHSGTCAQYDAVHGPSYNPPRKGGK